MIGSIFKVVSLPVFTATIFAFSTINISVFAAEASDFNQYEKEVKYICSSISDELNNILCQLAALEVGPRKLAKVGRNSTHASQKVINNMGNLCQSLILDSLKSPGSARFPVNPTTTEIFNGIYVVNGKVDAQNSYGALLRASYFCYFNNHPQTGLGLLGTDLISK
jgi:hypothetical protein